MHNKITLYSDKVPGAAREIWASVVSTTLRVDLQDLGENVPGGEYKYGIEGISLFMMRKHLRVDTNEEVFDWLKSNFSKNSAVDDLIDYLTANGINFQSFSF